MVKNQNRKKETLDDQRKRKEKRERERKRNWDFILYFISKGKREEGGREEEELNVVELRR